MAKSKAKKLRDKQIREGKLDPSDLRGHWNGIKPIERKTPTLTELTKKKANKHKKRWEVSHKDNSHLFYLFKSA
ncbi:hypothetical protein EJF36_15395 [Bacillus sp. HMF5848]|uniref:hypothetical protein n=1 Tax=Bacillus sp. HMF5848 TaxID=2495421 RepID=UPI000F792C8D|nr:hypothetical protein [Bacillus sp. HMF5848]RSK28154.1 hypothetical protein EJF36_15395 [Bacillus sp. HMF5848]